jgi:hypothetical protein
MIFKKGVLTSSVSEIRSARVLNVAREEILETQNYEVINYLVTDFKS